MDTKAEYRTLVQNMGKKEFTFLKMLVVSFWSYSSPCIICRENKRKISTIKRIKILHSKIKILFFENSCIRS